MAAIWKLLWTKSFQQNGIEMEPFAIPWKVMMICQVSEPINGNTSTSNVVASSSFSPPTTVLQSGHVKSSLMGPSMNIPVRQDAIEGVCCLVFWRWFGPKILGVSRSPARTLLIMFWHFLSVCPQIKNGRLALGTWQGIYLNEHRDQGGWGGGHSRRIIITLQGTS